MKCRDGCAACCIVISISSGIPGHPEGKPAGVVCSNLDHKSLKCTIWGTEVYPSVCRNFMPVQEYCGNNAEEAVTFLGELEKNTVPD